MEIPLRVPGHDELAAAVFYGLFYDAPGQVPVVGPLASLGPEGLIQQAQEHIRRGLLHQGRLVAESRD